MEHPSPLGEAVLAQLFSLTQHDLQIPTLLSLFN